MLHFLTYISVLTSCSYLQYADKVDQLLIWFYDYKNFLKIDEDDFHLVFLLTLRTEEFYLPQN